MAINFDIERHRMQWAKHAKIHGWYYEPFHIKVWLNINGAVEDSVAFQGLTEDIIEPVDGITSNFDDD